MQSDSSGDLTDSSGGDSVLPVIPRSSYLNRSKKSLKHIFPLMDMIRSFNFPKNFDPEKSSDYRYSMSGSYSYDGNEKIRDFDTLKLLVFLAQFFPYKLTARVRYLGSINILGPKDKKGKRYTIHNFIEDSHLEFQLQIPDVLANSTQSQDRHH